MQVLFITSAKGGVYALDWHIFLRKALIVLAAAAGVWLFAAVILPMFAPFSSGCSPLRLPSARCARWRQNGCRAA